MKVSSVIFMILYMLIALVGLFLWAGARDLGMAIFGPCLFLFGVLSSYATIKRHYDALEAAQH